MAKAAKRRNIYFRQTPKAFRADRQTKVFSYIKRSIPYSVYVYSRRLATSNYTKLSRLFAKSPQKVKMKFPKLKVGLATPKLRRVQNPSKAKNS
ncbi:MAG: hypothetical protein UT61_C0068G0013 [Candidatus Woesebacteria bacterium GW2011_GWA1_39_8]|jgi:hypothetical protein|uniref:Uncharacterized protein n=1 Tax=Candidatus Woesebacteria bacterium GW2011_GWA1_39_8 TaxID=1618552 RepID=A0A0G0RZ85_9BACT|nr:MAG: hypothetical protein UT61_C0068G0013 [Candidatus Woesebacteria bacterium GW2011_GWA1_39_8]